MGVLASIAGLFDSGIIGAGMVGGWTMRASMRT